ncbi:gll1640 [Gloeobacter violaceus PCC 7421]|uniref:Gll1640 protein n=1 Tax=Gloeobacter violaceus (strain ATCC 29082 / PCC 7421) TaxID=251221 RepID=Q7NK40_GLOVI|nr:gll1640 [Gloeobacter violaceus PCC 7421]
MLFDDATPSDVPELVALINASYRTPGNKPGWTDEREFLEGTRTDADALGAELDTGRCLIGRQSADGPIAACARIAPENDGAWYVASIAVDTAQQGKGTGREILAEVERQARAAGVPALRITVINLRHELIAWYERRGFVRTGEGHPVPVRAAGRFHTDGPGRRTSAIASSQRSARGDRCAGSPAPGAYRSRPVHAVRPPRPLQPRGPGHDRSMGRRSGRQAWSYTQKPVQQFGSTPVVFELFRG